MIDIATFTRRWITEDPAGAIDTLNLYAFVRNNPLRYVDYTGLLSEEADSSYSFRYRFSDFLYNPRFQGAMQAFGGLAEVGLGGSMTLGSVGSLGVLGWPVIVHGLDHVMTGIKTVLTGRMHDTATSYFLEKAGMSRGAANVFDNSLSMLAPIGIIRNRSVEYLTKFPNLHSFHSQSTPKNLGWVLPEKGKGALINDRWYTRHALERMAPRGLIQNRTEIVSRGVPPSVVENAITFGTKSIGNTPKELVHTFENVRVVTNSDATRIITVITTGR